MIQRDYQYGSLFTELRKCGNFCTPAARERMLVRIYVEGASTSNSLGLLLMTGAGHRVQRAPLHVYHLTIN